ncbi:Hypothetical predicted protein [Mytilus galloprovincialis]|uniref:Uncharacterized protein n=1 Tax=Mytilus galloprovincialis TaxID=29158 RepID=A0A8B6H5U5_MYTGA|nr:Hypothetical predicted protein [Mytilus galloprovincialis]
MADEQGRLEQLESAVRIKTCLNGSNPNSNDVDEVFSLLKETIDRIMLEVIKEGGETPWWNIEVSQAKKVLNHRQKQCSTRKETSLKIRYHRSCFKSYTSKHNLKAVACSSAEKETPDINYDFSNSLVPGNYDHPLDTSKCIICRKMSHKRVKTLHTISSAERLANLKDAAIRACDAEMIDRIEKENLLNKAVYHAACLTTYLAYRPKSNDK